MANWGNARFRMRSSKKKLAKQESAIVESHAFSGPVIIGVYHDFRTMLQMRRILDSLKEKGIKRIGFGIDPRDFAAANHRNADAANKLGLSLSAVEKEAAEFWTEGPLMNLLNYAKGIGLEIVPIGNRGLAKTIHRLKGSQSK
ncbi:MAG: hypothetical protein PHH08_04735, partial [Candidatus ainarchaeum sp.]|nr:hypothetical protein [Candidatus ainarchaeum sp.]